MSNHTPPSSDTAVRDDADGTRTRTVDDLTPEELRWLAWGLYYNLAVEDCNGGDFVAGMDWRLHKLGIETPPLPDDEIESDLAQSRLELPSVKA